mgnify:CR=1
TQCDTSILRNVCYDSENYDYDVVVVDDDGAIVILYDSLIKFLIMV